MLENLPSGLGEAMQSLRAGLGKITINDAEIVGPSAAGISVTSPAFAEDGVIPIRHTADGPGVSPPLAWRGVPAGAAGIVLLIEDADSPTPSPLVHAIAWNLPVEGGAGALAEGALPSPDHAGAIADIGRNSFLSAAYLPPDPPPGHGPHRYAFEIFALDHAPDLGEKPGRSAVRDALKGHVLGSGCLIATYERS